MALWSRILNWFIYFIILALLFRALGGIVRIVMYLVPPRQKCATRIKRGRPPEEEAWEVAAKAEARGPLPSLHVAVLVTGTRGDVDPFCATAIEIARQGHRVRLAAHACYRGVIADRRLSPRRPDAGPRARDSREPPEGGLGDPPLDRVRDRRRRRRPRGRPAKGAEDRLSALQSTKGHGPRFPALALRRQAVVVARQFDRRERPPQPVRFVARRGVPACVEIKILRRVRAESKRRPPRHRRDACSMAW